MTANHHVDAARAHFASITPNPSGRYMMLATDRLPNCGPELPDGSTRETVDAIATLRIAGINTSAGDARGGTR